MLTWIVLGSLAALAVVWGAYPLVMNLLARSRRRAVPSAAGATRPTVSVVLATRDDEAAVERRVRNLLDSAYPAECLEVVVAIDRSRGEPTPATIADHPRVRVVQGGISSGKASNLNAGVATSMGEVLVFADTHQQFRPDAIAHLVAALDDPRVGAVSGALELPAAARHGSLVELYWRFERRLRHDEARIHSPPGVTGAIWALRRELWSPLPVGLILDDVYTPMRVVLEGWRVAFAEGARAVETRRTAPAQEYRRKVRTLTGVMQLCAWLPAVLVPGRNPIWPQFVFHKLLRLLTPYFVLVVAIGLALIAARWFAEHVALGLASLGLVALAAALAGAYARVNVLRLAWNALASGMLMQAAVVVATVNGCRGRWDVWQR